MSTIEEKFPMWSEVVSRPGAGGGESPRAVVVGFGSPGADGPRLRVRTRLCGTVVLPVDDCIPATVWDAIHSKPPPSVDEVDADRRAAEPGRAAYEAMIRAKVATVAFVPKLSRSADEHAAGSGSTSSSPAPDRAVSSEPAPAPAPAPRAFKIGDRVRIVSHDLVGEVTKIDDEGDLWIRRYGRDRCAHPRNVVHLGPPTRRPLKAGDRVKRGPDWKWGDQDLQHGGTWFGVVRKGRTDGWVLVQWDGTVLESIYRDGADGAFDLDLIDPASTIDDPLERAKREFPIGARVSYAGRPTDLDRRIPLVVAGYEDGCIVGEDVAVRVMIRPHEARRPAD